MIPLTTLWLPILLSAVFVFIASNILHMAIPGWHRGDYGKLPDEGPVLNGLDMAHQTPRPREPGSSQRPPRSGKPSTSPSSRTKPPTGVIRPPPSGASR